MQVELSIGSVLGRSCGGGVLSSSLDPSVLIEIAPSTAHAGIAISVEKAHFPKSVRRSQSGSSTPSARKPAGLLVELIRPVVKRTSPAVVIVPPNCKPIPQAVHFIPRAVHFIPRAVHLIPPLAQMDAGVVQIIPPAVITVPLAAQLVPPDVITVPPDVITVPPDVITVPADVIAAPQGVHRASTYAAMTCAPFPKTCFISHLHTPTRSSLTTGRVPEQRELCVFAALADGASLREKLLHNAASFPGQSRRPSLLLWLLPTAGRRASHNINVRLTERKYQ